VSAEKQSILAHPAGTESCITWPLAGVSQPFQLQLKIIELVDSDNIITTAGSAASFDFAGLIGLFGMLELTFASKPSKFQLISSKKLTISMYHSSKDSTRETIG